MIQDNQQEHHRRRPLLLVAILVAAGLLTLGLFQAETFFGKRSAEHSTSEQKQSKDDAPEGGARIDDKGWMHIPANSPQLMRVRVDAVRPSVMPSIAQIPGRLVFDENRTQRVSTPVNGRVIEVRGEVGDTVKSGDTLAVANSPDLAQAQSDATRAEAAERQKQMAYERARKLYAAEVAPRKDLETAQFDLEQAKAETVRTRQRLDNLQARVNENGQYLLRSRINGTIINRNIARGMELRSDASSPLFTISDVSELWAMVDVPERYISIVKQGQGVQIEVDSWPGEKFIGKVAVIGAALDPATHRMQVRCQVPNPDGKLKPEMFARVSFLSPDGRQGFALPNTALVIDGTQQWIFVEHGAGVFEKRAVETVVSMDQQSFVVSGLQPEERVVTEGALLLSADASPDAK